MDQETKTSVNHDEIKQWIIAHKGTPQVIDNFDAKGDTIGIRIDFSGHEDEEYEIQNETRNIDWDTFFEIFEQQELALEFGANTISKNPSDLFHFIKRKHS